MEVNFAIDIQAESLLSFWSSNPSSGNLTYRYVCKCVKWHMFQVYSLWLYLYEIRKKNLKKLSALEPSRNELWHNSTMKFCATEKRIMKLFMCWDGKMSSKIDYYLKKAKCKAVYITCICICLYFYKDIQVEDTSDQLYSQVAGLGRTQNIRYRNQNFIFSYGLFYIVVVVCQ